MANVDFGWWVTPDHRRSLLCWHPHSGELVLHHPSGQSDLITTIFDETEIRRRLEGWEHHCCSAHGLGWLAGQLDGVR